MRKIIKLLLLLILGSLLVGCGNISKYIEQGNYNKAWEKAKTDYDKHRIIDILVSEKEYDKAFELVANSNLYDQEYFINALVTGGNYKEAYTRAYAMNLEGLDYIRLESDAAVISAYIIERLDKSTSFILKEVGSAELSGDQYIKIVIDGVINGKNESSLWVYKWVAPSWKLEYCFNAEGKETTGKFEYDDSNDYDITESNSNPYNRSPSLSDEIKESREHIARAKMQADETKTHFEFGYLIEDEDSYKCLDGDGIDRINWLAKSGELNNIIPMRDDASVKQAE